MKRMYFSVLKGLLYTDTFANGDHCASSNPPGTIALKDSYCGISRL